MLAITKDLDAVDENVTNAGRILHRPFVGCVIGNCCRIEQDHIRSHSRRQATPVTKTKILRR